MLGKKMLDLLMYKYFFLNYMVIVEIKVLYIIVFKKIWLIDCIYISIIFDIELVFLFVYVTTIRIIFFFFFSGGRVEFLCEL